MALLLVFVAGIGANLARGNQPDCHCFGQLHSEPAGWATLIRSGMLAGIAGFVAWSGYNDPGSSVVAWADDLTIAEGVVLGVALLAFALTGVTGWAVFQLLGQNGRLLVRIEALEAASGAVSSSTATDPGASGLLVGAPAPAFSLADVYGETATLDDLRAAGKLVLLVFADPDCSPCNELLPEIGHWQREHAAQLSMAVVSRGTPEANLSKSAEHGVTQVLLQLDREVAAAYRTKGTPAAVLILSDGTIGSTLAHGVEAIRSLVRSATATIGPRQPMPLRQVATNGHPQSPGPVAMPRAVHLSDPAAAP